MAKGKGKPFHMHALDKASATHLLKSGHIDKKQHGKICSAAEKGMNATRPQPKVAPAGMPPAQMPTDDGDEGMM